MADTRIRAQITEFLDQLMGALKDLDPQRVSDTQLTVGGVHVDWAFGGLYGHRPAYVRVEVGGWENRRRFRTVTFRKLVVATVAAKVREYHTGVAQLVVSRAQDEQERQARRDREQVAAEAVRLMVVEANGGRLGGPVRNVAVQEHATATGDARTYLYSFDLNGLTEAEALAVLHVLAVRPV
jgi:hypothetical protein